MHVPKVRARIPLTRRSLRAWDRTIELACARDERIHALRASRALILAYQGETRRAVTAVLAVPKTGP
jgi:hypothetical protein